VNDAVYYKNFHRNSKLQPKWIPYFRVMEKLSDRNLLIKNQLDNQVVKCHVDQVRKANIADWGLPKTIPPGTRPIRNCRYVVPPEKTEDSSSCDESDSADQAVNGRKLTRPKRRLVKMH
jgi:hypothetical protein